MNATKIADKTLSLADELRQSVTLWRRYRELVVVMVGSITDCAYEFEHHWNAARKAGVSVEQLNALAVFETSSAFDHAEKAVLRYSTEATKDGRVSASTWAVLKSAFNEAQLSELVVTVAWYNTVVGILLPLEIDLEPSFKEFSARSQ